MEIIDNRALSLNVRNPAQITTVIPKSKLVKTFPEGGGQVLVNWGLDEAQTLKNIGVKNVPSPIRRRYNWPGSFKPFDHQKVTAEFLTMHRRAHCFNQMGCVDSETEYLSPTGWRPISEYKSGEVAQYHPDSRSFEFVTPLEHVKLPCDTMVKIKTKYGVDQLLSPEHRVLLEDRDCRRGKTETLPAVELARRHERYWFAGERASVGGTKGGTDTIAYSASCIPSAFNYGGGKGLPISDEKLRLMVAVIADGHFGSKTSRCSVRLKKQRKIDRMTALLDAAKIDYVKQPCLPEGFTVFKFYAPLRLKRFDRRFWRASREQLLIITDEVAHWDSCVTRGFRFSTSVKESADFIQFAFFSTGRTARINPSVRERRGRVETEYVVQVRAAQRLHIKGNEHAVSPAPSTDGFKYCFMVPSAYLLFRRNGCVFASGNTGKTGAAAWAADYLMNEGKIKRVLVVCPLSIMDAAWQADLFKVCMHRRVDIAHGSADRRRKVIASEAEFVIINYDGVKVVLPELQKGGFDLIICDEASALKNPQTDRWKVVNALLKADTWLWLMTGTPAAQSPLDAYGLAKLVAPTRVPRFFGAWRDRVMYKINEFKWIPKQNSAQIVHEALQPAIRFTAEECIDLPELVYTFRNIPLTKQQQRYYDQMKKKFLIEAAGEEVTSVNAAVKVNKLLQISGGSAYTDSGEALEFDCGNRYSAVKEIVDESSQKVLIFVPYRHAIQLVTEKLRKDGITVDIIDGSIPAGKRAEAFKAFQEEPDPRVLVIQPQAAAHGVTLTAANTVIWWGPTSSLEIFAQANARVHRQGQRHPCTIVQLAGSAVERHVYALLNGKIDIHTKMIDLYKKVLE